MAPMICLHNRSIQPASPSKEVVVYSVIAIGVLSILGGALTVAQVGVLKRLKRVKSLIGGGFIVAGGGVIFAVIALLLKESEKQVRGSKASSLYEHMPTKIQQEIARQRIEQVKWRVAYCLVGMVRYAVKIPISSVPVLGPEEIELPHLLPHPKDPEYYSLCMPETTEQPDGWVRIDWIKVDTSECPTFTELGNKALSYYQKKGLDGLYETEEVRKSRTPTPPLNNDEELIPVEYVTPPPLLDHLPEAEEPLVLSPTTEINNHLWITVLDKQRRWKLALPVNRKHHLLLDTLTSNALLTLTGEDRSYTLNTTPSYTLENNRCSEEAFETARQMLVGIGNAQLWQSYIHCAPPDRNLLPKGKTCLQFSKPFVADGITWMTVEGIYNGSTYELSLPVQTGEEMYRFSHRTLPSIRIDHGKLHLYTYKRSYKTETPTDTDSWVTPEGMQEELWTALSTASLDDQWDFADRPLIQEKGVVETPEKRVSPPSALACWPYHTLLEGTCTQEAFNAALARVLTINAHVFTQQHSLFD